MSPSFHSRYLTLVGDIERNFPVAEWKSADVEIWPLARMDLYLDMYWAIMGGSAPKPAPLPMRAISRLATPLTNLWKSRRDLTHCVVRPRSAHAIFLGDGVSLDYVDGAWEDRFGEPLIAALDRRGLGTFVMQTGDLSRLPWRRPTFAANLVAAAGAISAAVRTAFADLPDHDGVMEYLRLNGVIAPSLARDRLAHRAKNVFSTASVFEELLRVVKPTIAFVVTYYAGLGPAFLLACRRRGILSVDLQHCPQSGVHKAYRWIAVPKNGYATLPAVFWNWTEADAANIRSWASMLDAPWHRSLHGGHSQIASFLDGRTAQAQRWDAKFHAMGGKKFEREILVALQPIGGYRAQWDALAAQIEVAPPGWRWWIRRHPASRSVQDVEYARLLSLRRPNVMVEGASAVPLPALLRHMCVLLSIASGASAEAAAFGVPVYFLSDEARSTFADLIERGLAAVIEVRNLNDEIGRLPAAPLRSMNSRGKDIDQTLTNLEEIAHDYSALCGIIGP
jgi:hypothetical protein